VQLS
jgi:hypothetical protein